MGAITLKTEQVIEYLRTAQGNIAFAATKLGTSRTTLHAYINEHPTVKAALDDIREGTLDRAETMLQSRMASSDTLLIFFLKTQGHKRGYQERHEISGPKEGPIKTEATVTHAIDGDTATTIFDILEAVGAIPTVAHDAKAQSVDTA